MQRRKRKAGAAYKAPEAQGGGEREVEKYLIFRCGQQMLGIHISQVKQIVQMPQLTPLPDSPDYIKGIACMHGEAVAIMDLRLRLGKPEAKPGERTCVIILSLEEYSFGVIVDRVENMEGIAEEEILPPPGQRESGTDYLLGIVGRSPAILLVSAAFFMSADDAVMLSQIAGAADW